ncbi:MULTISPECIES: phage terminase small subunit P27 family [Clostridium]|jgi:P27 family predicted phage terminase small subunit|uniref:Phage terminase small subunit P27 family n=1 Tax=Clostridium sporogenes TaxID=1509 RepID=A0A6G4GVK2_CLOSG|nr:MULTISPECIES: phage terminase small subunit P27 family [Clostridium]DAJ91739.1 MAG TPA: terminase small subunit [Caudoviricetes sp.]KRU46294.1 small subunit of phage terminase [Clostridium sporogenes]MBY6799532.1 phage terminase small subunit P27 family [Clostridium botulinum]MBY7064369.1 phage terminase small subunit P27 family [Clostridium sporogenes]MBY7071373.1 phage terminase small subunit P27 family [Clostridium sporogenes]
MEENNKIPKAPSFLNKEAKDKYYNIAEMLVEEGKWKNGDDIALIALCSNYQRWVQAEKAIKANKDLCFETESGYRQQIPEISIANNAMKSMLSFIKEFSLTPRERVKLKEMMLQNSNEDEEMEDMIVK